MTDRHLAIFCLIVLMFGLGLMQCGGTARAHDIYHEWKMPNSTVSCCDNTDCQPVRATSDMDGNWTVYVHGIEVHVGKDRILKMKSPDGRSHWCGRGEVTYCFVPGEARF